MPVVLIQLPKTEVISEFRPRDCPYCGSHILQRWGRVTKPVKARTGSLAIIYRYRCGDCKKTFRHYPKGVDRSCQTQSLRQLAGLLSTLGLSYRNIADIFKGFGVDLSYTTIWREAQGFFCRLYKMDISSDYPNITIDKNYIHNVSSEFGTVVSLGLGNDRYIILGTLNERNHTTIVAWLRTLVDDTDIKISKLGTGTLEHMHYFAQPL